MSAAHRQIVAIIGDPFYTLTNRLVDAVGNDSTTAVFHLDTKYYQAHVGVRQFNTGADLLKMKRQNPDLMIGAIILKLGTKDELEIMESVVKKVDCDSHVLVVDNCMHDDLNFAQSWAHSFRFELVILNPDPSQREEAKSLSEKCGIARVVEVIENVAWQLKKDNFKKITGKQGLDRLLAIIEAMSESSEDSDLEPDEEDKEAIWQAFSSCGIPPQTSETTSSSSVSKERECEATVSVDVTIVKNERKPDQWFSGLLDNKAKGVSDCDIPESTDFNFFQAIKDITGKQGLDRLLAIIEAMSESSEDSDLEPDEEDKEAIWQAFSSCGIPPQTSETTSSSSVSKERECEATVSVDVTIVKNERKPDQWFSGLLDNKAKGVSDCDIPESTDFNFFQAIKDTRDANMKLLDPAKRADNAAALLSKIVDLNMEDKDEARDKKNQ
ncbi:hypothetical protein OSTOST_05671 [Ostertagia ostertagi]